MTRLILSTSNVMNGSPSILRRPAYEKSNVELVNSLRSNFSSTKQAFISHANGHTSSHQQKDVTERAIAKVPYNAWTLKENGYLFVPAVDFAHTGLTEERAAYDITAKLFFLPAATAAERRKHAREAVELVLKMLHMPSIDLLIVSFSGVSYDEKSHNDIPNGTNHISAKQDDVPTMIDTWKAIESIHNEGLARQIGVAEFGGERLVRFLPQTTVRPSVDQINLQNCLEMPRDLVALARLENIELLTHSDCTNILPSGTIRELLGPGETGAGILRDIDGIGDGLPGEIQPKWVIKYTAVVRDRGVVEDKGYFAMADTTG